MRDRKRGSIHSEENEEKCDRCSSFLTGIIRKNTANDLHEIWRRSSLSTNCWNQKSLHSFRNRERLRTPNCVCLQETAWESKRLYDFIVVASQLLRMGATLGALQASQPSADEPKKTRGQPSDSHVLRTLLDYWEAGPLPEGDASIMNESEASPKESQVTHPT